MIRDYAGFHGLDPEEEFEDFLYLVRAMDKAYLEHVAASAPKPEDKSKGKP